MNIACLCFDFSAAAAACAGTVAKNDGGTQSAVCAEHPMAEGAHYVEMTLLEKGWGGAYMGVVGQGFDAAGGGAACKSAEGWMLSTGGGHLPDHAGDHHLETTTGRGGGYVDVAAFGAVGVGTSNDRPVIGDESSTGQFLEFGHRVHHANGHIGKWFFHGGRGLTAEGLAKHAIHLLDHDGLGRGGATVGGDDHLDAFRVGNGHGVESLQIQRLSHEVLCSEQGTRSAPITVGFDPLLHP